MDLACFASLEFLPPFPEKSNAQDGGQQLGPTDYLVTKGYSSDVEKPVEEMSMSELLDFQAGEKSDTYQTGKSGLDKKITGMTEDGELITEFVDGKPREVKSVADLTDDEKLWTDPNARTSKRNRKKKDAYSRDRQRLEGCDNRRILFPFRSLRFKIALFRQSKSKAKRKGTR